MSEEHAAERQAGHSEDGEGLFAGYSPHEHRPLRSYAALTGVFGAALAGSLVVAERSGRPLPERVGTRDIVLNGIAAHKLSRLLSRAKVTSFIRAPFTRYQDAAGKGELSEEARGTGVRRSFGELLNCPYCLSQWAAAAFTVGLVAAPRPTRLIAAMYTAETVADFLQLAYRAAEERA